MKSKDNATTLLHYIVCQYLHSLGGRPDTGSSTSSSEASTPNSERPPLAPGPEKAMLPLPEPSDVNKAALVNFEDIEKELKQLKTSLDCESLLGLDSF